MYDIVIIGAGVSGCSAARELSRYNANICVIDKEEDVCCGTSKANSGIVHAGYDAPFGSLKAKMNVLGNQMMHSLAQELDFPFKQNGSLVVCMNEGDIPKLTALYENGIANGVKSLEILNQEQLRAMEPNISDAAVAALYAPTAATICPFGLNIALAENAATNGVEFKLNTMVKNIIKTETGFSIETNNATIKTKTIINAAGVYSDIIHNMVNDDKIHITARRGDYCLLDKTAGNFVSKTIFQLPGKYGKGVLITPTVHGNIIIGPTAIDIEDKEGTNTTLSGLDILARTDIATVKNLPIKSVITSFAGLRAHEDNYEFIIAEAKSCAGFFDCAGIESPGLASSPAIGLRLAQLLQKKLKLELKSTFIAERRGILDPKTLSNEGHTALIKKNPAYGNIVCRCEMITEGEIIDSINRPLGAKSLDGVKRRTRTGMGRCQSGFCSPRTIEILARELNVPEHEITKCGGTSHIIVGINKDNV